MQLRAFALLLLVLPLTALALFTDPRSALAFVEGDPTKSRLPGSVITEKASDVAKVGFRSSPYYRALNNANMVWNAGEWIVGQWQDSRPADAPTAPTPSSTEPVPTAPGAAPGGGGQFFAVAWPSPANPSFTFRWDGKSTTVNVPHAELLVRGVCDRGLGPYPVGLLRFVSLLQGANNTGTLGQAYHVPVKGSGNSLAATMCGDPNAQPLQAWFHSGPGITGCESACAPSAEVPWLGTDGAKLPRHAETSLTCRDPATGAVVAVATKSSGYQPTSTGLPVAPCPAGSVGTELDVRCGLVAGALEGCGGLQSNLPKDCYAAPDKCVAYIEHLVSTPSEVPAFSFGGHVLTRLECSGTVLYGIPYTFGGGVPKLPAVMPADAPRPDAWGVYLAQNTSSVTCEVATGTGTPPEVTYPDLNIASWPTNPSWTPTTTLPLTTHSGVLWVMPPVDPFSPSPELQKADEVVRTIVPTFEEPAGTGSVWARCNAGDPACVNPSEQRARAPTEWRCVFLGQVVDWLDCSRSFPDFEEPNTEAPPRHDNPPVGGTNPTPTPTPSGTATPTPTPTPTPAPFPTTGTNPPNADGSASCLGAAWSWNPTDWVLVPLRCAFVPSQQAVENVKAAGTGLVTDNAPFSYVTDASKWAGSFGAGSQCFDLSIATPFGDQRVLSSCSPGPFESFLIANRAPLTAAMFATFLLPLAWWAWRAYAPGSTGSA